MFTRSAPVLITVKYWIIYCQEEGKSSSIPPLFIGAIIPCTFPFNRNPLKSLTRMHSSRMRTARSSSRPGGLHQPPPRDLGTPPGPGTAQDQAPPWDQAPPVDRHTPVNILPCPKLRLRAVTIFGCSVYTRMR